MNSTPIFSAEISIYNDPDSGMRIECSEKYTNKIKSHLLNNKYQCSQNNVAIEGTSNIHNLIEFDIEGNDFEGLKESVINLLDSAKVQYVEEKFNTAGEQHSRLNLTNLSVFDK